MNEIGKVITLFVFAIIGWALCGAIMGIGRSITSVENTLVIHAIGTPIIFATLSFIYFSRFNYTTPLVTALAFLAILVSLDAFLIAPFVEKSFAMFGSILGTWIPFALIFLSTYLTGLYLANATQVAVP